ncbi:MAG: FadR family transcriptional regulator [Firmicutes bacterium]|nr:FadR family transcriptional regulator [Bacillota bacterium]
MDPIKRVSLYEQVILAIQQMLRNGEVKVGERSPTETELAANLGVSRNSVREALKVLAMAGVIESTPGRGTFVRPEAVEAVLNPEGVLKVVRRASVRELMEVRITLEVEAAGLAARQASEDEIADLVKTWHELKKVVNEQGDWSDAGQRHHLAIAQLSGNELLVQLIESIGQELKAFRSVLVTHPKNMPEQI